MFVFHRLLRAAHGGNPHLIVFSPSEAWRKAFIHRFHHRQVRAAIRTFSPSEERHMQESVKFKKQLLVHNFQRVWRIVQSLIATAEFVNSCFTWENPRRTAFAFVVGACFICFSPKSCFLVL